MKWRLTISVPTDKPFTPELADQLAEAVTAVFHDHEVTVGEGGYLRQEEVAEL